MKFKNGRFLVSSVLAVSALLAFSSCGSSSSGGGSEDTSASGAAAGAAGGALSGSSGSGTLAFNEALKTQTFLASVKQNFNLLPNAVADTSCPTFRTSGSSCDASGDNMWLSYDDCSFGGSAHWNGIQAIESTSSASCGTFPLPAANGTITRQAVASSGALSPGVITVTSPAGVVGSVDDVTPNLGNFDNDSISTIANGGYGEEVAFNASRARSGITLAQHISASGIFDHSITGSLTVTETYGANTRTLNGSVEVYHNLLKVIGTATFNNVTHTDGCCFPTSGTISTVFRAGNNVTPTAAGEAAVGKTEVLTLTGCGTGTLQSYDGTTSNVSLVRCF